METENAVIILGFLAFLGFLGYLAYQRGNATPSVAYVQVPPSLGGNR